MKTAVIAKKSVKAKVVSQPVVGSSMKVRSAKCEEGFPRAGEFTNDWGKTFAVVVFGQKETRTGTRETCLGYSKIRMVLDNAAALKVLLAEHDAKGGKEE